ncbi:MAG: glycosyltransferase family 9 protein [Pseudomonadota bacterium]|nr:glycosyltransferase family 9 protein [Pseudomonadota bacterium]
MKILVTQLARFGDILQTVPPVKALRRNFPNAEIHVLVRSTFQDAATALEDATAVWRFNAKEVLNPLLAFPIKIEDSTKYVNELTRDLKSYRFDRIINLSFSPLSSFLCSILDPEAKLTSGYTRHSDGFLNIPDDASAYFYAQVGLGRNNRVHICDMFAQVAGINLMPEDFSCQVPPKNRFNLPLNSILIHIGASQKNKTFQSQQWIEVIKGFLNSSDLNIGLIGTKGELSIAEKIETVSSSSRLINLVGRTSFSDLFDLVKQARLIVAADSALMNVANLVDTKCLNLSSAAVNFWETGPRSRGSRILYAKSMHEISPTDVVLESLNMIHGEKAFCCEAESVFDVPSFLQLNSKGFSLPWQLIQAVYMGGELPSAPSERMLMGMIQLREVLSVIGEQIEMIIKSKESQLHAAIIDRSEDLIARIKNLCPELSPLIRWYETEKIRIIPGKVGDLAQKTLKICQGLDHVLSLYLGPVKNSKEGVFDENRQI